MRDTYICGHCCVVKVLHGNVCIVKTVYLYPYVAHYQTYMFQTALREIIMAYTAHTECLLYSDFWLEWLLVWH